MKSNLFFQLKTTKSKSSKPKILYSKSPLITISDNMTQARIELDEYTSRVLDVVKGKHGLKNRSEALQRLAREHGDAYLAPQPNEDVLRELDAIYGDHKRHHEKRKMSEKELREVLGL